MKFILPQEMQAAINYMIMLDKLCIPQFGRPVLQK